MTPPAARASIAAHLTDELSVEPHLATLTAASLVDRLTIDGWEIHGAQYSSPSAVRQFLDRLTRRTRMTGGPTA